jgi:type IV secretory pathway VirJ component
VTTTGGLARRATGTLLALAAVPGLAAAPAEPIRRPSERPLQAPRNVDYATATGANRVGYYYKPAAGTAPQTPAIFFSDETSWRPLFQGIASDLAAAGRAVLGVDASAYFKKMVPGEAYAKDLAWFRAYVNEQTKRPKGAPVLLAGMSFSAELIPYVLNRGGAAGVGGLLLIAPDGKGAAVHRAAVVLGMDSPAEEMFDVGREIAGLPPIPIVLMQGSDDSKGTARAFLGGLRGPKRLVVVPGGDHEFRGLRDLLSDHVAEALRWIDGVNRTPAPG